MSNFNYFKEIGFYPGVAKKILSMANAKSGICLDIGSYDRNLARAIYENSDFFVIAMDDSYSSLCSAELGMREKQENMRFRITYGEIDKIPLEEGSVDLVVCCGGFQRFISIKKAVKEIYRVTAKEGNACILIKNSDVSEAFLSIFSEFDIPYERVEEDNAAIFFLRKNN